MLNALGEVLGVRFEECTFGNNTEIDAWLLLECDVETWHNIVHCGYSCYAVMRCDQTVACRSSSTIDFSRHRILPSVLSGRQISSDEVRRVAALPYQLSSLASLASVSEAPVWAMQEIEDRQHHCVSLPIPELNKGEAIFKYFHGERFLSLLPLWWFLRSLTVDRGWEGPPLQGCFMFDDPNLHWRTYGFVNFSEMARHAQAHNYHVSFATIPLDNWFVHKPTAALFRQYRDQLSTLIHGNNHTSQELARPYAMDRELNRALRQALGRIKELEQQSGMEVARVMAPPHGACSERALEQMAQLGFEAACVSRGSLVRHNGQAPWARTFGMKPSDIVAGLTIIPRFRISQTCHNSILIAALLEQPIIPVGHHYDVAGGLQLLAELSGFLNSLGKVRWADMKAISRSRYARKIEANTLWVRMFSKRIEVCIPEGISQILVERPSWQQPESMPLAWKNLTDGSEWRYKLPDEPIPVISGGKIEIASEPTAFPLLDAKYVKNLDLWPLVRRQLTEARDRLTPVLTRLTP